LNIQFETIENETVQVSLGQPMENP
jgi:hypothetical protein